MAAAVLAGGWAGTRRPCPSVVDLARLVLAAAAELGDKLLASEHAGVLRDSVAWPVAELMEAEVSGLTGTPS